MTGNELRTKLHKGERVYGTMVVAVSPSWPAVAKSIGLDLAFIDTEHIAQDRAQLAWMCQLYSAMDVVPIVRIPSPDPYQAAMMLDGGARGVIAPYIESVDQVRELVGAVKYRPLKGEKLHAALTGQTPLEPELQSYLEQRNANNIAIVNVESIPALDALDEIVAVDGLDAVLIGPHDLSCSLGVPEQYTHPTFVDAVDTIIQTARARGIGAGIHAAYANPIEQEIRWANMGANLIVHAMDITAYRAAMRHDIDTIKAALDEGASERAMESINI